MFNMNKVIFTIFLTILVMLNTVYNASAADQVQIVGGLVDATTIHQRYSINLDSLPGELIDNRIGHVGYVINDLSIPMNGGMSIDVIRSFGLNRPKQDEKDYHLMLDWNLDVPVITLNDTGNALTSCQDPTKSRGTTSVIPDSFKYNQHWVYQDSSGNKAERVLGAFTFASKPFVMSIPFKPINLVIPGQPNRIMFFKTNVSGQNEYVTTDNWKATCITEGIGQGGFIVTSPTGIVYTFDVSAVSNANANQKTTIHSVPDISCDPYLAPSPPKKGYDTVVGCYNDILDANGKETGKGYSEQEKPMSPLFWSPRHWYATRIVDLHGNKQILEFNTSPNGEMYLKQIKENSETVPTVVFNYSLKTTPQQGTFNKLESFEANGQVYNYIYSPADDYLEKVELPEDRAWLYSKDTTYKELLSSVTNPYGGIVKYTYDSYMPSYQFGSVNGEVRNLETIKTRTVLGYKNFIDPLPTEILSKKSYTFERSIKRNPYVATNITTELLELPLDKAKKDVYKYYGNYNSPTDLVHGLLFEHNTYDTNSTLLQQELMVWRIGNNVGNAGIFKIQYDAAYQRQLKKRTLRFPSTPGYGQPIDYITENIAFTANGSIEETHKYNSIAPLKVQTESKQYVSDINLNVIDKLSVVTNKEIVFATSTKDPLDPNNRVKILDHSEFMYYPSNFSIMNQWHFTKKTSNLIYPTGDISITCGTTASNITEGCYQYYNYVRGKPRLTVLPGPIYAKNSQSVNPTGTIASFTDAKNNTTTYFYDGLNRLKEIHPPKGSPTIISWPSARQKNTTLENLVTTDYYDGFGGQIGSLVKDVSKNIILTGNRTEYDIYGNIVFTSLPTSDEAGIIGPTLNEKGVRNSFDKLGRLTSYTNTATGYSTQYAYQYDTALGFDQVVVTDPDNNQTIQTYETFESPNNKRLRKMQYPALDDGSVPKYNFTYNDDQVDIRNTTTGVRRIQGHQTMTLDELKLNYCGPSSLTPLKEVLTYHTESGSTVNTNNCAFQTEYTTHRGVIVEKNTYDSYERITHVDYPADNAQRNILFDVNGNVEKIEVINDALENITWLYTYNERNQLTEELLKANKSQFALQYQYDYDNTDSLTNLPYLSSIRYPSGMRIFSDTDAMGRTTSIYGKNTMDNNAIVPYINNVTYFSNNVIDTITFASGVTTKYALEPTTQRIQGIAGPVGTTNLDYTYYANSNIESINNSNDPSGIKYFTYDANKQLTSSHYVGGNPYEFVYDTDGNITSQGMLGSPKAMYQYTSLGNLLDSVQGLAGTVNKSFTYDNYGNIAGDDVGTYLYNWHSGLKQVTKTADGSIIKYDYDGNNRLYRTIKADETLYRGYNKHGSLMFEYAMHANSDQDWYREFIYLESQKIFTRKLTGISTSDTDTDGIVDAFEIFYGLNMYDPNDAIGALNDPDNDGRDNLQEFKDCSDPNAADLPGSVPCIAAPVTPTPGPAPVPPPPGGGSTTDTDSDGIMDDTDNCILIANTNQLDGDNDGYGNVCDGDLDNDGLVVYGFDINVFRTAQTNNDMVADLNGDGLITTADSTLITTWNGLQPGPSALHAAYSANDTDGDGITNDIDNCIVIPNTNQLDSNADGYGNRCDADLNNDGMVTLAGDYALSFNTTDPAADINDDGVIDTYDVMLVLLWQNLPPGPSALAP